MKESQWAIAVGVLAVLVFVIVFAGQYIGGLPDAGPPRGTAGKAEGSDLKQLTFPVSNAPADPEGPPLEVEEKSKGDVFFYFVNENDQAVRFGLNRAGCKCTEAELLLLPDGGAARAAGLAAGVVAGLSAPLDGCLYPARFRAFAGSAKSYELKKDSEAVTVPAGAVGWVRLGWEPERAGPQRIEAAFWNEDKEKGQQMTLLANTVAHETFHVHPSLSFGTVKESDLAGGVTNDVLVVSSTRISFRLRVDSGGQRSDPKSDPMEIGTPKLMTAEERRELERRSADHPPGSVLSGWKVPLTMRAVAADGKTPAEIGPFRRSLSVSSPDCPATEPKQVAVTGRVRGLVEIGNDGDNTDVSFGSFARRTGKTAMVSLTSDVSGLELKVDAGRTAKFLDAKLEEPVPAGGGRRMWKLRLTARPGAAFGKFPRKDDPLYDDSAVYLTATAPGQTPRAVRIAVYGTATEG